MCDKDHFAESVAEYEARGLVTRRQFGVLLAAGAAMMLPEVANAQATTERDVEIKTPDGTCDAYFVHPSSGAAAGVLIWPDIFGLRPAGTPCSWSTRSIGLESQRPLARRRSRR
jgi:carboxymethylenebutenolidase